MRKGYIVFYRNYSSFPHCAHRFCPFPQGTQTLDRLPLLLLICRKITILTQDNKV